MTTLTLDPKEQSRELTNTLNHIKAIQNIVTLAHALRYIARCSVSRSDHPEVQKHALFVIRTYAKAALRECGIKE